MAKKKQKSGRKPINDQEKVVLVGFYVKRYIIDALGGMDKVRELSKYEVETAGKEIIAINQKDRV